MTRKPKPRLDEVAAWLADHHGRPIEALEPLAGGYWSAGFAYRLGDEALVMRLGESADGYRIDRAAFGFAGPGLPIPEVLEVGECPLGCFAISRRHFGCFVETRPAHQGEAVGRGMAGLLAALRAVPASDDERVEWYAAPGEGAATWRDWLLAGIADAPVGFMSGWREKLAASERADAIFRACEERIHELLPACPERRDLVHGDLLHQNVLVDEADPARVTAVFSWKCSARGDFLYDVAWCTHWSPWHPAIAAGDLWRRTLEAPDLDEADLADAPLRHHAYELQIAASHFGWYAWNDDAREMAKLSDTTEAILERGPLAAR